MANAVTIPLGPAEVNLVGVRAGDRNLLEITLTADGTPIDLTGQTVTAQARTVPGATDSLDAVCAVVTPLAGTLTVRWPGPAVATWLGTSAQVTGVWDLQLAPGGGADPLTVMAGRFTATADVSRP